MRATDLGVESIPPPVSPLLAINTSSIFVLEPPSSRVREAMGVLRDMHSKSTSITRLQKDQAKKK
jgi:hypothetical protein